MMNDEKFIRFVKNNSKYFKKCIVSISIYGKIYGFNVVSITDNHIKIQHKFNFDSLFHSREPSIEHVIKNIIDEDGVHKISHSYALSQRAVTRRNLRGFSFSVPVENVNESFVISNISQKFISVEKIIDFEDIKNSKTGLGFLVKNELAAYKPNVDETLKVDEEKRLKKEELRHKKQKEREILNKVYSKDELISLALDKKFGLKNHPFPVEVMGKKYQFSIDGVGDFAVKLSINFHLRQIFDADSNTLEEKIRDVIYKVLGTSFQDSYDFIDKVNDNQSILEYHTLNILIGDNYSEFKLITYFGRIKLLKFVRYEEMMDEFKSGNNCLETQLKTHIEVFKPKPFNWGYSHEFVVPKDNKKEYKHPTVSKKEDPEVVRKKIAEKQKARKKHDEDRSYSSTRRSSDMNRILR